MQNSSRESVDSQHDIQDLLWFDEVIIIFSIVVQDAKGILQ